MISTTNRAHWHLHTTYRSALRVRDTIILHSLVKCTTHVGPFSRNSSFLVFSRKYSARPQRQTPFRPVDRHQHRTMFRLIRTCLAESNVHGLPFLVNRSLTVGERSVWLLCVAVSVTLATFVCRAQWQRYDQHPIVLSLETDHLDWRLQRPAVTMCDWYFDELVAEELVARWVWWFWECEWIDCGWCGL